MKEDLSNILELSDPPDIPELPDELTPAVCALAQAAFMFRGVFVQAAEGKPVEEIFEERAEHLALAEKVVDAWCRHLGVEE